MNNIQKELLLLGYDFPSRILIRGEFYMYHNEEQYSVINEDNPSLTPLNVQKIERFYCPFSTISLDFLKHLPLERIKILNLTYDNLSDISGMSNLEFENLDIICLKSNYIQDIEPLTTVFAPNLNTLDLRSNQIKDFNPLLRCDFPKLEFLKLGDNYKTIEYSVSLRRKFPLLKGVDNVHQI